MNKKSIVPLILCLGLITIGCRKDYSLSDELALGKPESVLMKSMGATQYDGIGYYDDVDACNVAGQEGAAFAVRMTGDLEGCLYVFVDEFECSPSGTYREVGRELFIGTYKGSSGSFWTTYRFEAKYEGCAEDGSYLGAEILGRCQHPLVDGSGEGVFEGVSGRLDMKDDIEAGNYPYRGHFKF